MLLNSLENSFDTLKLLEQLMPGRKPDDKNAFYGRFHYLMATRKS